MLPPPGQFNHRVVRRGNGVGPAVVKALSEADIAHLRAVDQFHGAIMRRFACQDFLHEWIIHAKLAGQECQRIGQRQRFEVGVNRLLGEKREFERCLAGIREFAKAVPVGLRTFFARPQQCARYAKAFAHESLPLFEQRKPRGLCGQDFRRVSDLVVGRQRVGKLGLA